MYMIMTFLADDSDGLSVVVYDTHLNFSYLNL